MCVNTGAAARVHLDIWSRDRCTYSVLSKGAKGRAGQEACDVRCEFEGADRRRAWELFASLDLLLDHCQHW